MDLSGAVKRVLPHAIATRIRHGRNTLRFYRDRLFLVDISVLANALSELGIRGGDVLYVRSSYDDMRSIRATPLEIIDVLCKAVGESGTVIMPAYPMGGLSQVYLDEHPFFDWRRTPSQSGILTEIFRRMPGTERSLHPTHPIAARGALAQSLTEGHERCETPFDERSPYYEMLKLNALVLSIGRFDAIALHHLADHVIRDRIPYPIYSDRAVQVQMTGKQAEKFFMITRAHNPYLACDHRVVQSLMAREGGLKCRKVGRVPLSLVRLQPFVEAYRRYHEQGIFRHYQKPRLGLADSPG